jgi:hypothetical protein
MKAARKRNSPSSTASTSAITSAPSEVPGSKGIEGLADGQQMRLLTLELTKKAVAKTLILESPAGNKPRQSSSPSRRILRAKAPAL